MAIVPGKPILRNTALALLAVMLPVAVQAAEELKKARTDNELIEILKADGYRAVEQIKNRAIKIKIDGHTYVLYVYDDDDLQLYFGLTGFSVTADQMNDWNRTKRLSRAYLDDDNDPILEADLLANAGYTNVQLVQWLGVFDSLAREFRQFLNENDQSK